MPVGSSTKLESVAVVELDVSVGIAVDDYDASAVKAVLARLYREDFARFGYATEVGASRAAIANNASAGGGAVLGWTPEKMAK